MLTLQTYISLLAVHYGMPPRLHHVTAQKHQENITRRRSTFGTRRKIGQHSTKNASETGVWDRPQI